MPHNTDDLQPRDATMTPTIEYLANLESSVSINRFGETIVRPESEDTAQRKSKTATAPIQKLGKYDVVGLLGKGAFGAVYRGTLIATSRSSCRSCPR